MHHLYPVFHERFEYVDGTLYVKKAGQWKGKVGDKAGSYGRGRKANRIIIQVCGERFFSYEIIWIMFKGDLPQHPLTIDHEDRDPTNDRIGNLRAATPTQQQANSGLQVNNTTGFKGVCYLPKSNKGKPYKATYGDGKHLGWYATPEEAAKAYDEAAKAEWGIFAVTNKDLA